MIKMHKVLAKRINVKVEETQGLDMCTISLHNLLHVDEDIQNFSATDNYWCAVFERAVKDYVKRSNNCKGVEGTFAKAEARREFLKSLQEGEFLERTESNDTNQVWNKFWNYISNTNGRNITGVKLLMYKLFMWKVEHRSKTV